MALPTTVTLAGDYGASAVGFVDVELSTTITLDGVTYPRTHDRVYLTAGAFTLAVYATDDAGVSPINAYYRISEYIDGNKTVKNIFVPAATVGNLDVNTATPVSANAILAFAPADLSVTAAKLAADAVTTAKILNSAVTTAKIANDAVDGTKIPDDAVNSEHIAAGAIDPEHFAALSVETAAIANDAVTIGKTNFESGLATLVAGTVVVSNTTVAAGSIILLTCQTPGGTPGFLRISARTAATSFTILSSSATDTSVVGWLLLP